MAENNGGRMKNQPCLKRRPKTRESSSNHMTQSGKNL